MTKTRVEIDDNLIEQARRVLGTSSVEETIGAALREVLRGDARRQEIRAHEPKALFGKVPVEC